ncbi:hypothetical protein ACJ72_06675 [Emergomyces africanus]|uniref:Uncharacterized protein n=1 Tax=Emergomyces africanus TaxID=1955775 RepID=A0A1B7NQA3_9EURO|nr:hypothetical protein ACJ72_06675 [Emergomyces africanus]
MESGVIEQGPLGQSHAASDSGFLASFHPHSITGKRQSGDASDLLDWDPSVPANRAGDGQTSPLMQVCHCLQLRNPIPVRPSVAQNGEMATSPLDANQGAER